MQLLRQLGRFKNFHRLYSKSIDLQFWEFAFPTCSVRQIRAFTDNYIYFLRDSSTEKVAVIDPGEAAPVLTGLGQWGWKLDYILATHHHFDHTGGINELKDLYKCPVVGSSFGAKRIPGIDIQLDDGANFDVGETKFTMFHTHGHTRDHISFASKQGEEQHILFSGDTVFAMGCGRLFEGTAAQMFESLNRVKALGPQTTIFAAHEYTLSNAKFALCLEPGNTDLQKRAEWVEKQIAANEPTVPFVLEDELLTSPFFRWQSNEIHRNLGLSAPTELEAFTAVRRAKDSF